jgi:hypothetical protein
MSYHLENRVKTLGNILISASSIFFIVTAFEMYLLTLVQGRQMLFFSLVHIAPGFFLIIVALSGIAFVCLAICALVVVVLNLMGKMDSGGNYPRMMLIILLIQVVHTALLLTYDYWAAALFP